MSSFETKKSEALRLLEQTGIWRSNYLPPATKTLWRLGFEVPPPHFISFGRILLFAGIYFAVGWGVLMYLFTLLAMGTPVKSPSTFALLSAGAGFLFGLSMATYYAYGRWKHGLPSWEALGDSEGAS